MIAIIAAHADWLPYIAIAIAALTFAASQREVRRRAKVDYVTSLEGRVEDCEKARGELQRRVRDLEDENVNLLRRVMGLEART